MDEHTINLGFRSGHEIEKDSVVGVKNVIIKKIRIQNQKLALKSRL
jgi:hypothetical protein